MSTGPLCVYCASSIGTRPEYAYAAQSLGTALAKSGRMLVYGGGNLGLMGVVSRATLEAGGHVTGVTPYAMLRAGGEGAAGVDDEKKNRTPPKHPNRVDIIVDDMHARKVEMAKRAEGGFISLPGGYGTFEELLEVTTWSQLAIHVKPVVLVNVLNYYDPLREQIRVGIEAGFIRRENMDLVTFVDGPEDLSQHATFDWGAEAMKAIDAWQPSGWKGFGFDWTQRSDGPATPLHAV